jgi:RNA polymerase sigma-70 factor (ECF subfamily)
MQPLHDILRRIQAGDTDAFREVIRVHASGVRAFLAGHIRDFHTAEDIAQEVFVAVFAGLDSYDMDRDLGPWIRAIARNKLMSHLRREYGPRRLVQPLRAEIADNLAAEAETDDRYGAESAAFLQGCINKHPARDRELLEARYFANEAVNAIAKRLDTTVSAISSQLYRLRHQLRDCIEAQMIKNPEERIS